MFVTAAAIRRLVFLLCAVVAVVAAPSTAFAAPSRVSLGATIEGSLAGGMLTGHLTLDTDLLSQSHLSAWQIDQYLAEYTVLPPLGHAFKAAEATYGVNALYLLAHAMHETAFGTSYIAQVDKNLFGWTAYDRNPLAFATRFPSFAVGIDYVASQIASEYLSPTGRYWGGAPTVRGMHLYATDPQWGWDIVGIANSMTFPTLAGRLIRLSTLTTSSPILTGRMTTISAAVTTAGARVPNGLRVAARFRPISIVEANAPASKRPPADPPFALVAGSTQNGRIVATVKAPAIPGRYELDLQIRDTDGTVLSDGSRLAVPGLVTRVFGAQAVTYSVTQSVDGLSIAVTNVGRTTIPALGGVPLNPSTIGIWALPDSGPATLIEQLPLGTDLAPGATWAGTLPNSSLSASVPGVIMLRLDVAGADARMTGSPPGVFRLSPVVLANSVPAGTNAGGTNAGGTNVASTNLGVAPLGVATGTGQAGGFPGAAAAEQPVLPSAEPSSATGGGESPALTGSGPDLTVQPVTPADPGTDALLGRSLPSPPEGAAAAADPSSGSDLGPTPAPSVISVDPGTVAADAPPAAALTYELQFATSVAGGAGSATVRVTNVGTGTIQAFDPAANLGSGGTAPASALVVDAVPASASAAGAIRLIVPLASDLAPGTTTNLAVNLPSLPGMRLSYLVSAQIVPAIGGQAPTTPGALFWMRGPAAAPIAVATTGPAPVTATVDAPNPTPASSAGASVTVAAPVSSSAPVTVATPVMVAPPVFVATPSPSPAPSATPVAIGAPATVAVPSAAAVPSASAAPSAPPVPSAAASPSTVSATVTVVQPASNSTAEPTVAAVSIPSDELANSVTVRTLGSGGPASATVRSTRAVVPPPSAAVPAMAAKVQSAPPLRLPRADAAVVPPAVVRNRLVFVTTERFRVWPGPAAASTGPAAEWFAAIHITVVVVAAPFAGVNPVDLRIGGDIDVADDLNRSGPSTAGPTLVVGQIERGASLRTAPMPLFAQGNDTRPSFGTPKPPAIAAAPSTSTAFAADGWLMGLDRTSRTEPATIGRHPTTTPTSTTPPAKPALRPTTRPTAPRSSPTGSWAWGTATADRMALLTEYPGQPGLWIYVVRSGDVFESIANWFGVSVATMHRLNPYVVALDIHPGQRLILTTPTR